MVDKPRKFYEELAKQYLILNDCTMEKFQARHTGNKFLKLSEERAKIQLRIEKLLDNSGFIVGELYYDKTLLYLASNGEMIPEYQNNQKRDRNFMINLYEFLYKELSQKKYHQK